jgi:hypothetical protein
VIRIPTPPTPTATQFVGAEHDSPASAGPVSCQLHGDGTSDVLTAGPNATVGLTGGLAAGTGFGFGFGFGFAAGFGFGFGFAAGFTFGAGVGCGLACGPTELAPAETAEIAAAGCTPTAPAATNSSASSPTRICFMSIFPP